MGQIQSIVSGLEKLKITSCNGDEAASDDMQIMQDILMKNFWIMDKADPGSETQNNIRKANLNSDEKFNQAKFLKDILNSIIWDQNGKNLINLRDSTNNEDQHLYLIIFLLWTFALRPGSKDQYVGKGPCTLKWRHLNLDTENRTVTLRFPTKGFSLKGLKFRGKKVFSITVHLQEAQEKAFELLRDSKEMHGDDDHLFSVSYDYVSNYLKTKNQHLVLRNFRTAAASYVFQRLLEGTPVNDSEKNKLNFLKECAKKVQKYLQHTTVGETIKYYLDPRIIIAWCKEHKIDVSRLPKSMKPNNVGDLNQTEEIEKFRF